MHKLVTMCVGVLLLGAGCATVPDLQSWWGRTEADFQRLRPGVTTQADVLKQFGTPDGMVVFDNLGEQVWDYYFADGSQGMLAWVVFDLKGSYKHYVSQPDPRENAVME